jgi:hypothetical protein
MTRKLPRNLPKPTKQATSRGQQQLARVSVKLRRKAKVGGAHSAKRVTYGVCS